MNFKLLLATCTLVVTANSFAQDDALDDGSEVILPVEAQSCDLPAAPARIPEQATYDDLVKAKGNISEFQGALTQYRECLDASKANVELTQGNQIALTQAHNYSVELEERVAESFNVAVRAYKASQAESTTN